MLVLLLLVLCVCFHVACVMYLHLTSIQVGLLTRLRRILHVYTTPVQSCGICFMPSLFDTVITLSDLNLQMHKTKQRQYRSSTKEGHPLDYNVVYSLHLLTLSIKW